ncbi:uncharacterized protein FA14DRAFT_160291 [Meira miltonrushii]|uniref:Uncharacterized protein n=1 Tax=Meira miltonrushii TaxID=1280837 RepID=A0A316VH97_9BASI|nr:uncharacterized protein FA14DRAFT_160291 [Meira miltonrushii]PWN34875.1 hypothetical protein FA14DRAFT_160291 [Meira miltonrushii]
MPSSIARQGTKAIHSITRSSSACTSSNAIRSPCLTPSSSRMTCDMMMGQSRSLSTTSALSRNTPARRPKDPLDFAPNAVRHALPSGETLIVRPPPTVASPRYTTIDQGDISPEQLPLIQRRKTHAYESNKRLSAEEIAEMQRLRQSNPDVHTALQLAKQFGCSATFVRIVAPAPKQRREAHLEQTVVQRSTWGQNKTMQRELRKERRSLW